MDDCLTDCSPNIFAHWWGGTSETSVLDRKSHLPAFTLPPTSVPTPVACAGVHGRRHGRCMNRGYPRTNIRKPGVGQVAVLPEEILSGVGGELCARNCGGYCVGKWMCGLHIQPPPPPLYGTGDGPFEHTPPKTNILIERVP